ncbi:hypothetical protein SFA35_02260 [Pseudomonas sp. HR96]|uniref:hypothetical protein n=1 Tax=Pseudomonas sp. HR96 TaxID=1027966 RepID=UPI002A756B95|nr:hypothetical protein [Pseudomonas sp. HR96]WPP00236.1 hypothetical protein SFA35_02260 [Pseudomonas sp. HR96]
MLASTTATRPLLVYLAFGKDTYHQEAVFSIASAFAAARECAEPLPDILVFTDNPSPYRSLPVDVRLLDQPTREAWSEPHGYHFRIKHVALRQILEERELALLIDTDTLFRVSPLRLFERIQPGTLLCNVVSRPYGECRDSPLYTNLHQDLEARGLADDAMATLNSGVIGLHRSDAAVLDHSIALMDELYPRGEGAYVLEEFCLAIAARARLALADCPDLIHHYWSRKTLFRAKVRAWLRKHGQQPLSDWALQDLRRVSLDIPRPSRLQRLAGKLATAGLPMLPRQFMREVLNGFCTPANEFDQACARAWWDKARENFESRAHSPLTAPQLRGWLETPGVRLLLGQRRHEVFEHLMAQAVPER